MPVRTDRTLITILEHKNLFFALMDKVERQQNNPSMEFTISDYNQLLVKSTAHLDKKDQQKQLDTLSLDNLEQNGLLNYQDSRSGRFRLQDFVLEMLRHLDNTRMRELSSAELNQLMAQLEQCYKQVSSYHMEWAPGEPQFEEMVEAVYYTLQHVDSRLRIALRALRGQAERLASKVDEQAFTDLQQADQMREALKSILHIHERHVTPTLQFLDERLDIHRDVTELDGSHAPMALVRQIIDRFRQRKMTEHVSRLTRVQLHILSNAQEVGDIAKSLDTYIKFAEDERRRYNRIEDLYNALRSAVQERQTGQLRDWRLRPDDEVFRPVRVLGTLKSFNRSQNSKISWPEEDGTSLLDELLRVRLEAEEHIAEAKLVAVSGGLSEKEIARRNNMDRILAAMESFPYGEDSPDIYRTLHEHLVRAMPGYTMKDIFDAVPCVQGRGEVTLAPPRPELQIAYAGQTLTYQIRTYTPVVSENGTPTEEHARG